MSLRLLNNLIKFVKSEKEISCIQNQKLVTRDQNNFEILKKCAFKKNELINENVRVFSIDFPQKDDKLEDHDEGIQFLKYFE